ncbi:uncharacterized protein LOC119082591 [Bradysia coprophila]|uniref:uncharacterized protein LOC119082591 n=1 Tax=Bradysia coprophila TaxID=38358 RepID=UPI00187DB802|nr:uncharacterized protein LOC119082591 [Bradysia coprophila]
MNRKRSLPQQTAASPEKKPKLCLYLEDNTPIRTVEVSNVPTDLSEDLCKVFIQGYFERDGPVERVEISRKTDEERLAYVTFAVPDDAAELIENRDVPGYTRCSKFIIKIADDEHQIKIDPNVMSLEKVNDNCLLYIMSHLTLMDVINLCKTSTRMQSAGQIFYKQFGKFAFGMTLTDSSINETNLPVILEAIGDHITSIDWHYLTAVQFELLVKHCPNVTELKLSFPKRLPGGMISRNKHFFAGLKKLYIESSTHIYDINLKYMMSGRNLRTLDLHNCNKLRGNFFNKLNISKLKTLKIVNCQQMDKKNVPLSEWKNKFTTLAIDTCCSYLSCLSLPPEKLAKIKELQLDISCFKGTTDGLDFSGLTKLKKLTLTRKYQYNYIDSNNMINGLAQIDSLESLHIQGITVDTNTILGLRSIKNLRYLRMDQIENKIGRNLYEQFGTYMSTLQELSLYFGRTDVAIGKTINDMIAGMPMLNYFSHSSITWEWLDGIRQAKSVTAFAEKPTPLKIGVTETMFHDPKKQTFEAAHKGAITLSIHE